MKKQQHDDLQQNHQKLKLRAKEVSDYLDSKLSSHQQHSLMLASLYQSLLSAQTEDPWPNVSENFAHTILAGFVTFDDKTHVSPANWVLPDELSYQANDILAKHSGVTSVAWGDIYFDESYVDWLMPLFTTVASNDTAPFIWTTVVKVDDLINDAKLQFLNNGLELFIFDESGVLISHPDYGARLIRDASSLNGQSGSERVIRKSLLDFIEQPSQIGVVQEFEDWGDTVFAVTQTLNSNNWTVAIYSKNSFIYKDSMQDLEHVIGIMAVATAFMFFISIWLSRRLVAVKLKRISKHITDAGNGRDIDTQKFAGSDEFDNIHRQLAQMYQNFNSRLKAKDGESEKLKLELDENKALAQAVSYSDNAVLILDLNFTISFVDTQVLTLLSCERDELLKTRFFGHIHHHMAFVADQIINDIRRKESWHGELVLCEFHNEREIWVNATITPLRNDAGHVTKYVVSLQDISFIKDSQHRIEKLAYTDELTSLANRSFFVAQLEKFIEMKKRGHFEFSVLHFDIDDFKRVNDKLGYDGGDLLLMEMAARLQQELRGEDVLARLGGDEFAFIVVAADSEQSALSKVKSILNTVSTPFNILGQEVNISTSIGISMSTSDDPNLLLQHADLAMYEAKSKGKNTFHFFTKELNDVVQERMSMEHKLNHAIENDALALYYQPKVDINSKALIGYEALLRWEDPELGFVSPAKFIPIAEQSNLILKIGEWVMEKSIAFTCTLEKPVPVSINLSGKQFDQGNCAQRLAELIEQYQVAPELVEIEITESYLMTDVEDAIRQLEEMKQLGVNISIDDFGTGYSSLSYLKRLPVDTLKIDRSFIQDIPGDINDVEITGAIIAMAQKLGLHVIAEGAETQEQIEFLKDNGCLFVQGFFYSKPLPAEQAKAWCYNDIEH